MLKTDLSKFNNSWYQPGNSIKRILWFGIGHIFINSYFPSPIFIKIFILKLFGAKIAANVVIKPKVNIKYPWKLSIGQNSWIGEDVWIDNLDEITIGSDVCISQGAILQTGSHDFKSETFDLLIKPIILEDGVWICTKSIVCQGVRCFSHSVLGAGSVASKNLSAYSIYRGNPAIIVGKR